MPLCSYERPPLVLAITNQKKSTRFSLFWTKAKTKIVFRAYFVESHYKGSVHLEQQWEQPRQTPPKHHSASQHPGAIALNSLGACVLYPHLLCASVSKMCLKVSEKPKWDYFLVLGAPPIFPYKLVALASSLYAILVDKSFHRNTPCSGIWGNQYIRESGQKTNSTYIATKWKEQFFLSWYFNTVASAVVKGTIYAASRSVFKFQLHLQALGLGPITNLPLP